VADNVYRITEVVGSSTDSIHQAVRNAVTRAAQTLRNIDWFEVTDIRGHVENGDVGHFQVTVKIGFRLDDGDSAGG
jgi:flavin-binding protein dodecin